VLFEAFFAVDAAHEPIDIPFDDGAAPSGVKFTHRQSGARDCHGTIRVQGLAVDGSGDAVEPLATFSADTGAVVAVGFWAAPYDWGFLEGGDCEALYHDAIDSDAPLDALLTTGDGAPAVLFGASLGAAPADVGLTYADGTPERSGAAVVVGTFSLPVGGIDTETGETVTSGPAYGFYAPFDEHGNIPRGENREPEWGLATDAWTDDGPSPGFFFLRATHWVDVVP
jgi:hypothetical protein